MEQQTNMNYDRICLGRISPVQVWDGKRFNDEMNRGVDFDIYMSYEEHAVIKYGKPYQVYEYCIDGVWYRRAHIVTFRNSGLINQAMYGNECVVAYNSANPGHSCWNKNISIQLAKEKYHLHSLMQKWPQTTSVKDQQSTNKQIFQNKDASDVNKPYLEYTSYETTGLEKAVAVLGLCAFFFGLFIWVLGPIAIIISAKSLNTPKRNRNYAYTSLILGIFGTIESIMGFIIASSTLLSIISSLL